MCDIARLKQRETEKEKKCKPICQKLQFASQIKTTKTQYSISQHIYTHTHAQRTCIQVFAMHSADERVDGVCALFFFCCCICCCYIVGRAKICKSYFFLYFSILFLHGNAIDRLNMILWSVTASKRNERTNERMSVCGSWCACLCVYAIFRYFYCFWCCCCCCCELLMPSDFRIDFMPLLLVLRPKSWLLVLFHFFAPFRNTILFLLSVFIKCTKCASTISQSRWLLPVALLSDRLYRVWEIFLLFFFIFFFFMSAVVWFFISCHLLRWQFKLIIIAINIKIFMYSLFFASQSHTRPVRNVAQQNFYTIFNRLLRIKILRDNHFAFVVVVVGRWLLVLFVYLLYYVDF